jgi:hypothetical protein
MKFIERINGYWLQEIAIQLKRDGKDGRKMLTDALPNLSAELVDKLLEKRALLKGNSIDRFEVDGSWLDDTEK